MSARINKKVLRVLNTLVFSASAFIAMPSQAVTAIVQVPFQLSTVVTLFNGDVLVGVVDNSRNTTGAECGDQVWRDQRSYFLIKKEWPGSQVMISHAMAAYMAGKTLKVSSGACMSGYALPDRFDF